MRCNLHINWIISVLAIALLIGGITGYKIYNKLSNEIYSLRVYTNKGLVKNSTDLLETEKKLSTYKNITQENVTGLSKNQDVLHKNLSELKKASESSLKDIHWEVNNIRKKTDIFTIRQDGNTLLLEPTKRVRKFYSKHDQPIRQKEGLDNSVSEGSIKQLQNYENDIKELRNELSILKSTLANISFELESSNNTSSFEEITNATSSHQSEENYSDNSHAGQIRIDTLTQKCRAKVSHKLACIKSIKVIVTNISNDNKLIKLSIQRPNGKNFVNRNTYSKKGKAVFEIYIKSNFIEKGHYIAQLFSDSDNKLISEKFKI